MNHESWAQSSIFSQYLSHWLPRLRSQTESPYVQTQMNARRGVVRSNLHSLETRKNARKSGHERTKGLMNARKSGHERTKGLINARKSDHERTKVWT